MTVRTPQVWLPAQFAELTDLPPGLEYVRWDGRSAFPSDPAEVEFYAPPLTKDIDVIDRPLPHMTRLRAVQALSSGTDELRAELDRLPRPVTLCNAGAAPAPSTAELALTLILASLRGIPESVRAQDGGAWGPEVFPSLYGRSVLVVGYGAVGSALEELLVPFGCAVTRVAGADRDAPRGPVRSAAHLPRLVSDADVVVLSTPLTPQTRQLFDAGMLARMKDGALLVNVARGAVVDTDALLKETHEGRLRAALDVTDPEPLPPGHPLRETPGVLITPHVGAFTSSLWPRLEQLIRHQLSRFAAGEELENIVSR
ncbi:MULTISPECIES: 2-hydroxyacid dehydrogenase [Streptomyces]|uniref:Dehydrogenase n=1 Tax=Streptomyces coelicolor (strain ATCC BAA-471 / A3(2) / M145) TaxID=100226 RepID=Q9FC67_STRCO|nr:MULTISPECIES: 2-hydroxyacid dehydrogenase [Streptomyces]MDX2926805.1 2-hydroxyacid dehydrogenase [Streptomyces sp. NRRL_B-16638]MYU46626.1 dehydrogenase [Streptomyces sp. SID7813]NSL83503.1 2-hydroxyacid dehydrogenase [Streptomyces coelicolor]QFI46877.1 dehydrogenase [Streptomyces coelicolor A3(2)]QKN70372.1 2-hydroxyacid dehydrogenase [Streptomyces coelicolor]